MNPFLRSLLACSLIAASAHAALAVPTPIRLSTGEVITVDIIEANAETIKFVHPVLGEITVPRASIEILDAQASEQVAEMVEQAAPPEPEKPKSPWKTKINAGGALTDGNSDSLNFNAGLLILRETERMVTKIDAAYFYAESNDERSESRFTSGIQNDWLMPDSRWFFFARARFDADEFQSWDTRLSGHGGVGYRLFREDPFKLNLRAGAGATKEWGSEDEELRPELLFGVDGSWKISEKQSIVFDATIFPDLDNTGEFRTIENVGYSILLDEATNLSLTAGLQHEHQSDVDEDREKDDIRLFAGLALEF